jgi:hypothetical protein
MRRGWIESAQGAAFKAVRIWQFRDYWKVIFMGCIAAIPSKYLLKTGSTLQLAKCTYDDVKILI